MLRGCNSLLLEEVLQVCPYRPIMGGLPTPRWLVKPSYVANRAGRSSPHYIGDGLQVFCRQGGGRFSRMANYSEVLTIGQRLQDVMQWGGRKGRKVRPKPCGQLLTWASNGVYR